MEELYYLGISLGFNSSACVVSNKRGLIAAVSQERLNGEKNTKQFPFEAVVECLNLAGVKDIECLAISHYETIDKTYFKNYFDKPIKSNSFDDILREIFEPSYMNINRIRRVHHHTAHAFSPFAFYGIPHKDSNYTLITSDGFGDGASGSIYHSSHGMLSMVELRNSIGLVYQFVTGALGFKEHQHEGKITGLAAYGKPLYIDKFEELYNPYLIGNFIDLNIDEKLTDDEMEFVKTSNIIDFDHFLILRKKVYRLVKELELNGAKREDIAATVQEFAEKHTLKWIKARAKYGGDAYLSGGLFANVKINQRIKDAYIFNNVYVCPAMGDEGTAVGAAMFVAIHDGCKDNILFTGPLSKVRIGSTVRQDTDVFRFIVEELDSMNLLDKYNPFLSTLENIKNKIVNLLIDGKIVCLMKDKMEFGPRALCNRSILYDATKRETNDSLNKRLSRSEFMPFAPVCREEVSDDLFKNLDGGRDSSKFMTMTFDGTDEFVNTYKAVAHIDGTARPQIINKDEDSFMWELLKLYEEKTGLKCLVNTSFNLHNNPIIRIELTGLNSFLKADLDALVIGNVIIEKKEGK